MTCTVDSVDMADSVDVDAAALQAQHMDMAEDSDLEAGLH
ncbi:hypothetical protein J6TS1_49350 [Siminovitchia terrae]|uniref:Uncharacterized protein n=1 Tax=Siminovitchia terrae TaxID=1914933 RepID=A0ABQ4L4D9_SIMTE|nr:hypothetical protein J22TS1_30160 [Siminovitchia terrae]GIN99065.1 hypothetical protein J6TS1_49350 [Siminovitchia terrae]